MVLVYGAWTAIEFFASSAELPLYRGREYLSSAISLKKEGAVI